MDGAFGSPHFLSSDIQGSDVIAVNQDQTDGENVIVTCKHNIKICKLRDRAVVATWACPAWQSPCGACVNAADGELFCPVAPRRVLAWRGEAPPKDLKPLKMRGVVHSLLGHEGRVMVVYEGGYVEDVGRGGKGGDPPPRLLPEGETIRSVLVAADTVTVVTGRQKDSDTVARTAHHYRLGCQSAREVSTEVLSRGGSALLGLGLFAYPAHGGVQPSVYTLWDSGALVRSRCQPPSPALRSAGGWPAVLCGSLAGLLATSPARLLAVGRHLVLLGHCSSGDGGRAVLWDTQLDTARGSAAYKLYQAGLRCWAVAGELAGPVGAVEGGQAGPGAVLFHERQYLVCLPLARQPRAALWPLAPPQLAALSQDGHMVTLDGRTVIAPPLTANTSVTALVTGLGLTEADPVALVSYLAQSSSKHSGALLVAALQHCAAHNLLVEEDTLVECLQLVLQSGAWDHEAGKGQKKGKKSKKGDGSVYPAGKAAAVQILLEQPVPLEHSLQESLAARPLLFRAAVELVAHLSGEASCQALLEPLSVAQHQRLVWLSALLHAFEPQLALDPGALGEAPDAAAAERWEQQRLREHACLGLLLRDPPLALSREAPVDTHCSAETVVLPQASDLDFSELFANSLQVGSAGGSKTPKKKKKGGKGHKQTPNSGNAKQAPNSVNSKQTPSSANAKQTASSVHPSQTPNSANPRPAKRMKIAKRVEGAEFNESLKSATAPKSSVSGQHFSTPKNGHPSKDEETPRNWGLVNGFTPKSGNTPRNTSTNLTPKAGRTPKRSQFPMFSEGSKNDESSHMGVAGSSEVEDTSKSGGHHKSKHSAKTVHTPKSSQKSQFGKSPKSRTPVNGQSMPSTPLDTPTLPGSAPPSKKRRK